MNSHDPSPRLFLCKFSRQFALSVVFLSNVTFRIFAQRIAADNRPADFLVLELVLNTPKDFGRGLYSPVYAYVSGQWPI